MIGGSNTLWSTLAASPLGCKISRAQDKVSCEKATSAEGPGLHMASQTSCIVPVLCLVVVGSILYLSSLQMSDSIRWTAIVPIRDFGETTQQPVTVAQTPIPVLYKKNYTKLPQWDFEDVYNTEDSSRKTTCEQSLWKAVENDPDFKEAFIPNIQIFLENDSISMSEWNRLSHFNNPFGFMEYHYDDLMPTIKLIPKPEEPLIVRKPGGDGCVRCAVVATGGILNGSKMGKEIDAHDYVFRMNGAVIDGFEEDVGTRTSVYVHTAHSITTSLYVFKKFGYKAAPHDQDIKYVLIPEGRRDFNWMNGLFKGERIASGSYKNSRPRLYYGGQFSQNRFYVLHQDFLRYVRNRFLWSNTLKGRYWPIVRPTNGAFTLFLALHTCDVVDAYGFMTENHKDFSNYYAERNIKTRVIFYINHDYNLEKNTWKKLHDAKIIKLYQRSKSGTVEPQPKQP